jgi:hypothetical protein
MLQNAIERWQAHLATIDELVRTGYQILINAAERFQKTYGDGGDIAEFIHYMDELTQLPNLDPKTRYVLSTEAEDLHNRYEIRVEALALLAMAEH